MSKTRIILADDHDVVRKGLTFLLGRIKQTEVVGEATDGHQAVELAEKLAPALVIMDVAMPLFNGIDAAAQILKRRPETSVILLSMHADEDYVIRGLNAGVKGYIPKNLLNAICHSLWRRSVSSAIFLARRLAKCCCKTTSGSSGTSMSRTLMTCLRSGKKKCCS
jgi:DNA-binding NarL/FixJ family response regulator